MSIVHAPCPHVDRSFIAYASIDLSLSFLCGCFYATVHFAEEHADAIQQNNGAKHIADALINTNQGAAFIITLLKTIKNCCHYNGIPKTRFVWTPLFAWLYSRSRSAATASPSTMDVNVHFDMRQDRQLMPPALRWRCPCRPEHAGYPLFCAGGRRPPPFLFAAYSAYLAPTTYHKCLLSLQ